MLFFELVPALITIVATAIAVALFVSAADVETIRSGRRIVRSSMRG